MMVKLIAAVMMLSMMNNCEFDVDFNVHGHGNGGVIIAVVWKNKDYRSQGIGNQTNSGKVEI